MTRCIALLIGGFVLLSSAVASAETNEEPAPTEAAANPPEFQPRTLIRGNGKPSRWRGFSSPMLKLTTIDGNGSLFIGGRGAAVLDHLFAIGGGGFTVVGGRPDVSLSYGGPSVSVLFFAEKLVHFDLGLMAAWGRSRIGSATANGIFVLEPEVNVELNVAKSFRIALGASYRYVGSSGSITTAAPGLGGLAGNFALRFGSL